RALPGHPAHRRGRADGRLLAEPDRVLGRPGARPPARRPVPAVLPQPDGRRRHHAAARAVRAEPAAADRAPRARRPRLPVLPRAAGPRRRRVRAAAAARPAGVPPAVRGLRRGTMSHPMTPLRRLLTWPPFRLRGRTGAPAPNGTTLHGLPRWPLP